jgi:hypothetical protein
VHFCQQSPGKLFGLQDKHSGRQHSMFGGV